MFNSLNKAALEHQDDHDVQRDDVESLIDQCMNLAEEGLSLPPEIEEIQAIEEELNDLEDLAKVVDKHGNAVALMSFANRGKGLESLLDTPIQDLAEMDAAAFGDRISAKIEEMEEHFSYEDHVFSMKSDIEQDESIIAFEDEDLVDEALERSAAGKEYRASQVAANKAARLREVKRKRSMRILRETWMKFKNAIMGLFRRIWKAPGQLWGWLKTTGSNASFSGAKTKVMSSISGASKKVANSKGAKAVSGLGPVQKFMEFSMRTKVGVAIVGTVAVVGGIVAFVRSRRESFEDNVRSAKASIGSGSWSSDKASSITIKAISSRALMDEIKTADDIAKIQKAVFGSDIPTTESEYSSWTSRVDAAMSNFKDIYGISVDWSRKRPKVSGMNLASDHKLSSGTADGFGYDGNSINKIEAAMMKALNSIDRDADATVKALRSDVEATVKAQRGSGDASSNTSDMPNTPELKDAIRIAQRAVRGGGSVYATCCRVVASHTAPKAGGIVNGLSRCYE